MYAYPSPVFPREFMGFGVFTLYDLICKTLFFNMQVQLSSVARCANFGLKLCLCSYKSVCDQLRLSCSHM